MQILKVFLGMVSLPALVAPMVAQISGVDIGSGAGWVGVGLLGPVLWWLCYQHLPAKDKQLLDLMDRHSAEMDRQFKRYEDSTVRILANANGLAEHNAENVNRKLDEIHSIVKNK